MVYAQFRFLHCDVLGVMWSWSFPGTPSLCAWGLFLFLTLPVALF